MSETRKYFDDINDMEDFLREVFFANNGASFDKDQLRKRIIGLVKKSPLQQKVEEAEEMTNTFLDKPEDYIFERDFFDLIKIVKELIQLLKENYTEFKS